MKTIKYPFKIIRDKEHLVIKDSKDEIYNIEKCCGNMSFIKFILKRNSI